MSRLGESGTGGGTERLRRWPFPFIAFLLLALSSSRSLASSGTEASATSILSAAASVPPACLVRLAARDGADRTLFETVAAATATPGLAVAPLHPLERGGVRWRSLAILPADSSAQPVPSWGVTSVAAITRERDQVTLEVPGLPACGAGASGAAAMKAGSSRLASGAAVLAARGRDGYRNRLVGGRVERVVDLPGDRRLLLVRLLDDQGADPGLLFDPAGSLLGSVLPATVGDDPALATVVLEPDPVVSAAAAAPSQGARDAITAAPSPSVLGTIPGLVSQALRLAGPSRYERGLALLDEVARVGGVTVSLLLEKGAMEFGLGKIESAVKDFRLAAGKDPSSHLARYNLGIALGTEGRYEDAAAAFRSARDLQPEHGRTRFQLALALRALGLRDEARAELQDLTRIDPVLAGELRALIGA